MSRLAPLSEEPTDEEEREERRRRRRVCSAPSSWKKWLKTHFSLINFHKKSDIKVLLSVIGCPLFPVPPVPKVSLDQVSSSAQYIIQHFTAATGCRKQVERVKNTFVTGKVTMAMVDELGGSASGGSSAVAHKGCFVMWQMVPDKWLIELVVGGHKVAAGSDGHLAWRYTPWLGEHAAKGAVRPLRRALQILGCLAKPKIAPATDNIARRCSDFTPSDLQRRAISLGLDPAMISSVFSSAQFVGEKQISGTDCFVLKLSTDQTDLTRRSDTTAEMIKHVAFGHFCQKSGLLVYLEDSSLTRIQIPGSLPTYWETSMRSSIEDYRPVEGIDMVIAHSGKTDVLISRFGDTLKGGISITRMEETWTIDDVAFDVPGLSVDCFIPPKEVKRDFYDDKELFGSDWRRELHP